MSQGHMTVSGALPLLERFTAVSAGERTGDALDVCAGGGVRAVGACRSLAGKTNSAGEQSAHCGICVRRRRGWLIRDRRREW